MSIKCKYKKHSPENSPFWSYSLFKGAVLSLDLKVLWELFKGKLCNFINILLSHSMTISTGHQSNATLLPISRALVSSRLILSRFNNVELSPPWLCLINVIMRPTWLSPINVIMSPPWLSLINVIMSPPWLSPINVIMRPPWLSPVYVIMRPPWLSPVNVMMRSPWLSPVKVTIGPPWLSSVNVVMGPPSLSP